MNHIYNLLEALLRSLTHHPSSACAKGCCCHTVNVFLLEICWREKGEKGVLETVLVLFRATQTICEQVGVINLSSPPLSSPFFCRIRMLIWLTAYRVTAYLLTDIEPSSQSTPELAKAVD